MLIEFKDYYFILGVSQTAGPEDVRRAFRKLARLYHPDLTGNDAAAETKFKEINEAYEVLSDPDKKRRYDDFNQRCRSSPEGGARMPPGWNDLSRGGSRPRGQADHFTFTGTGFSEFFDQLFGSKARGASARPRPESPRMEDEDERSEDGDDLEADLWVTLEEAARGALRQVTMRRSIPCPRCFGVGEYNGRRCAECDGGGRVEKATRLKVKIPQGVPEGGFLRIPSEGDEGAEGGRPGDLYLRVHYARHPEFRVEGSHLIHELELAPWEAVLGANIIVPTLGPGVQLKIPPGTQAGQKLRLKGRGLPMPDGAAGDLIVITKIQVPRETSEHEQLLWRELAGSSSFYPRSH